MSETDEMNVDERRKYLHKMRVRYWQAKDKTERGQLLDETQVVTGLHRKSVLRLLHGELARKARKKQRGKTYGVEVDTAIAKIARSLDYPCAERLPPSLGWMADHLQAHAEISLTAEVREQLNTISVSSVRRRLPRLQRVTDRIAQSKRSGQLTFAERQAIPIRRIDWQEQCPGHFETDLVHHCGISSDGQYVHTLQMLDVASGWSECVAVLGRSYLVMHDGFEHIASRLPFEIHEIHPDNGAEFLHIHMVNYWRDKVKAEVSRSRPFHKNDNRFVEENNASLVRAYIGYGRLDTVAQTRLLNQLYDQLWLYHNLFQPVTLAPHASAGVRLSEKQWHDQKLKRLYDKAAPPLDRLCQTDVLTPKKKQELLTLRQNTNPIKLRLDIESLLARLHTLPCVKEGVIEDVRLSLFNSNHDPQTLNTKRPERSGKKTSSKNTGK